MGGMPGFVQFLNEVKVFFSVINLVIFNNNKNNYFV